MGIRVKVIGVEKLYNEIPRRLMTADDFWTFAANEWHRLISKYTPKDTGTLMNNVTIKPKQIEYNSPYAMHVYHGDRMNFRKDQNPLACAHWDEAAQESELPKLIQVLQRCALDSI